MKKNSIKYLLCRSSREFVQMNWVCIAFNKGIILNRLINAIIVMNKKRTISGTQFFEIQPV